MESDNFTTTTIISTSTTTTTTTITNTQGQIWCAAVMLKWLAPILNLGARRFG
jgi:hypothetical protein